MDMPSFAKMPPISALNMTKVKLITLVFVLILFESGCFADTPPPSETLKPYSLEIASRIGVSDRAGTRVLLLSSLIAIDGQTLTSSEPMDVLDLLPTFLEGYECVLGTTRLSNAYQSLFDGVTFGQYRFSAAKERRYKKALSILYLQPDPALLLRGKRPTLEPSDLMLNCLVKRQSILSDWQSLEPKGDPLQTFVDALIERSGNKEISEALACVRDHDSANIEMKWAEKQLELASSHYICNTSPYREDWLQSDLWIAISVLLGAERRVDLELKVIDLSRTWLDLNLILSQYWVKVADDNLVQVSTGHFPSNSSIDKELVLPWFPNQLLLIRNVKTIGAWSPDELRSTPSFVRLIDSTKPVIAGVVVKLCRKCPNPDSKLAWPPATQKFILTKNP
jgi:hypothetical protein